MVAAIALAGLESGRANLGVNLLDGHAGPDVRASRADDILLHHGTAKVVRPAMERHTRQLGALGRPRCADVGEIIEHQAREGDHAQILTSLGLYAAHRRVFRLIAPADETGEAIAVVRQTLI